MSSTINILHLIDHYKIGGPGKTIINSFKYSERSEFSIYVATFVPNADGETEFTTELQRQGIPYLGLKDSRGLAPSNAIKLRRYIQEKNVVILHSHAYKSDILVLMVKWITPGLKVITTHHGWITNTVRQKCLMKLDLFLTRFFDGIIVVSKDLLCKIPQRVVTHKLCAMIHNAIVLDDYKAEGGREAMRARLSVDKDETVFAVVGRLSPEKGCREMLQAFALVHEERPNTKLLFVGEGPLAEELKKKSQTLGLNDAVIYAGHHNPVNPFYEAADVIVCPSLAEGLSNVILEALAYHLPVVATDVGGNGEIIEDGINGILVKPKDVEEMKKACIRLAASSELTALLGKQGRETVERQFDFIQRIRMEEAFYEDLMQSQLGWK